MKILMVCFLSAICAFAWPWSSKKEEANEAQLKDSLLQVEMKNLQLEVETLTRIRMQKADSLEKLETDHWRKRYAESKLTEDYEIEIRELEGRYGKLSTDLGRVNEEVIASKNLTSETEENASAAESAFEALNTQVKLSIGKNLEEVPGDYPIGMNARLLKLKEASIEAEKKSPNTLRATQLYFEDLLKRQQLTFTQNVDTLKTQMGNIVDVNVYRLRLGTVFLGDMSFDKNQVQALFRSGTLQGKIFEWNNNLPLELETNIKVAIENANQKNANIVVVPLDVLQNKAIKNAIADTQEKSTTESFKEFFKKGGIVMYPLMLVALFALLLSLERFLVLSIRGRLSNRFIKKVNGFIKNNQYKEAADLCLKKENSLSKVLFAILNKANESRENAERSLQEALLREQPKLERRMGLLAAMGSIAPLLGLLGTVTGIITLFTVITEVGTNDAKVLAGGISEALITTETGLVIAIPVMILHGLLSEKIEKIVSELYVQSTSVLNKIFDKSEM